MGFLKKFSGYGILSLIAVLPLVLWLTGNSFSAVTADTATIVSSLGKAVALSGIALYAVMPILSMRHRAIMKLFGGIDKSYKLHKSAGKLSFYLIILHPLLLGGGRLLGGQGFTTIWDWSGLLVLSGIIALSALIFVTGVSIYAHIRHQNWIWIHRLFGWMIPLFFAHALLARSQIVANTPLFIYMLTIATIGFSAFLYRSVFSRLLMKKHRYVVSEINRFTNTVAEVVLKPLGVPITYEAGQFAFLSFDSTVMDGEAHPFSFSNANNGPYARFTIKALGDDTTDLQGLKEGTIAYLEGPYGEFSFKKVANRKQVWIAGGIGITPFLSMARSFTGSKHYDIRFFYGSETLEEAVFLGEFQDITRHLPNNFKTSIVSKDIHGFVTVELLQKSLGKLTEFDYMICGPPAMMQALLGQLTDAGVPDNQIHIEAFSI